MKKNFFNACVKSYVKSQLIISDSRNYLKNEKGATTVEYALLVGVITVLVIGAATAMNDPLKDFFTTAIAQVKTYLTSKGQ